MHHEHYLPKIPLHPTIVAAAMQQLAAGKDCMGTVMGVSLWERDVRLLAQQIPKKGRDHTSIVEKPRRGGNSQSQGSSRDHGGDSDSDSDGGDSNSDSDGVALDDITHGALYKQTAERRISCRYGQTEYGEHADEHYHRNVSPSRTPRQSLAQVVQRFNKGTLHHDDGDDPDCILRELQEQVNSARGRACDTKGMLQLIRPLLSFLRVPEVVGLCRYVVEANDVQNMQKVWNRMVKQGRDADELFSTELQQRIAEENERGGFGVFHAGVSKQPEPDSAPAEDDDDEDEDEDNTSQYGLHACICTARMLWSLQNLHPRFGERVEFDQTFKVFAKRRHFVLAAFCAVHPNPQQRTVHPLMWVIFDESTKKTKIRRMTCAWSLRQFATVLSDKISPPRKLQLVVTDWEKANMSGVMDVQLEDMHAEASMMVREVTDNIMASSVIPQRELRGAREWAGRHEELTPRVVLARLAVEDITSDSPEDLDEFVARVCEEHRSTAVVSSEMTPPLACAALEDLQAWIIDAESAGVQGKQHSTTFPQQMRLVRAYEAIRSKYWMVFVQESSVFQARGCTFYCLSATLEYVRDGNTPAEVASAIMGRMRAVCYSRTLPAMARAVGRLYLTMHQTGHLSFLRHFRTYWLRSMGELLLDPVNGAETSNAVERIWGLLKNGMKSNSKHPHSSLPHTTLPYLGLHPPAEPSDSQNRSFGRGGHFDVVAWTTRENRPIKPLRGKDRRKVNLFIDAVTANMSSSIQWRYGGVFWVRADLGLAAASDAASLQASSGGRQPRRVDQPIERQRALERLAAQNKVARRTPTVAANLVRKRDRSSPPKPASESSAAAPPPSTQTRPRLSRRPPAARRALQQQQVQQRSRPRAVASGPFEACAMGQRRCVRVPSAHDYDVRQEMRSHCSCVVTSINSATGYCIIRRCQAPFTIATDARTDLEVPLRFPGTGELISDGDLHFDDNSSRFIEWEEATVRLVGRGPDDAAGGVWTTVANMREFDERSVRHIHNPRLELFPKRPLVHIGAPDSPFGEFTRSVYNKYWELRTTGFGACHTISPRAEKAMWRRVRQEVPASHLTRAVHHQVLSEWLEDSRRGETNNPRRLEMLQYAREHHVGVLGIALLSPTDEHCYNISLGGPHWFGKGRYWEVLLNRDADGELVPEEDAIWKLVTGQVRRTPPYCAPFTKDVVPSREDREAYDAAHGVGAWHALSPKPQVPNRVTPVSSQSAVGFVNLPVEFLLEWDMPANTVPSTLESSSMNAVANEASLAPSNSSSADAEASGENEAHHPIGVAAEFVSPHEPLPESGNHTLDTDENTASRGNGHASQTSPTTASPSRVTRARSRGNNAPTSPFLTAPPRMPERGTTPSSSGISHYVVNMDMSTCTCATFVATRKCEHLLGLAIIQRQVEDYFCTPSLSLVPDDDAQVERDDPSDSSGDGGGPDDGDITAKAWNNAQRSASGGDLSFLDALDMPLPPRMVTFALQTARFEMATGSETFALLTSEGAMEQDDPGLQLQPDESTTCPWDHAALAHATDGGYVLAYVSRRRDTAMYWSFGSTREEPLREAQARMSQYLESAIGAEAALRLQHFIRRNNGDEIHVDAGASLIQLSRWIMQLVANGEPRGECLVTGILEGAPEEWRADAANHGQTVRSWLRTIMTAAPAAAPSRLSVERVKTPSSNTGRVSDEVSSVTGESDEAPGGQATSTCVHSGRQRGSSFCGDSAESTAREGGAFIDRRPIPSPRDVELLSDYTSGLLTDQVVDFALSSYHQELQATSVMLVSAGTLLINGHSGEYDARSIQRIRVQVEKHAFVLLPLSFEGHHTIALWVPGTGHLHYFDSLRRYSSRRNNIEHDRRAAFTREAVCRRFGLEQLQLTPGRGPQQPDGINCGAFAIAVGCALMKGISELSPGDAPSTEVHVPTPDRRLGNEVRKWIKRVICADEPRREGPGWLQEPWLEEDDRPLEHVQRCLPNPTWTPNVASFFEDDGMTYILSEDMIPEQEMPRTMEPEEVEEDDEPVAKRSRMRLRRRR